MINKQSRVQERKNVAKNTMKFSSWCKIMVDLLMDLSFQFVNQMEALTQSNAVTLQMRVGVPMCIPAE